MQSTTNKGKIFEQKTIDFLMTKKQMVPWVQNYRTRAGELDLILIENQVLVFVEVRSLLPKALRSSIRWTELSVDHKKQNKLLKTAEHFLWKHEQKIKKLGILEYRFDIVVWEDQGPKHIKGAFDYFTF